MCAFLGVILGLPAAAPDHAASRRLSDLGAEFAEPLKRAQDALYADVADRGWGTEVARRLLGFRRYIKTAALADASVTGGRARGGGGGGGGGGSW